MIGTFNIVEHLMLDHIILNIIFATPYNLFNKNDLLALVHRENYTEV